MARPVTLFTGQWADLPLTELVGKARAFGYDGLELACWGDHLDVDCAAEDKGYAEGRLEMLAEHGLKVFAISNHLAGQLVCDPNDDARSDTFAPERHHGDADAKRAWAVETMKNTSSRKEISAIEAVGIALPTLALRMNFTVYSSGLAMEILVEPASFNSSSTSTKER